MEKNHSELHEQTIIKASPTQWTGIVDYSIGIGLIVIASCGLIEIQSAEWSSFMARYEMIIYTAYLTVCLYCLSRIIWRYLTIISTEYLLTTERLFENKGISIFRNSEPLELYEIIDYQLPPARLLALVGCGDLKLITKDVRQPEVTIKGVKNPKHIYQSIRTQVEDLRISKKAYFGG